MVEQIDAAAAEAVPHMPGWERLWWTRDQMHFPRPVYPYTMSTECGTMSRGFTTGFQSLGVPIRYVCANFGGYNYFAVEFFNPNSDEWMPQVQAQAIERLTGLLDRWRDTYLPEVLDINARIRDFDYAGASTAALIAQIDDALALRERQFDIHMLVVAPVTFAASELGNLWEQTFGPERRHEPLVVLQGFPNKTMESGAELWKLSRAALAVPDVARMILESPVRRIVPLLGTTEAGRAFKVKLDAFLETYGWRAGAFELADPSWIEDPSVALTTLRDFMKAPADADPALREQRAADERDEMLARVSEEIDAAPAGPMLRLLLGFAQQYLPIQEDHNFYIDQMNTVIMRMPPLEAGRRLAATDALAVPEDVFLLTVDEVKRALRAPSSGDWAEIAAERRAVLEGQRQVNPPMHLGAEPDDELLADAAVNSFSRFFGDPIEQDESSNVLTGTAASRGKVTGRACVVHTLDEAGRLQQGDILVCEMTMPAWTPLFAVASAVVTDSGGALSHSAIVAREYGVPCVVGTTSGTRRIADGQRITVDGTNGTVTIEPG